MVNTFWSVLLYAFVRHRTRVLAHVRAGVLPVCLFHQIKSNPIFSPAVLNLVSRKYILLIHATLTIYHMRSTFAILMRVAGRCLARLRFPGRWKLPERILYTLHLHRPVPGVLVPCLRIPQPCARTSCLEEGLANDFQ
jgi:hypothetical protein